MGLAFVQYRLKRSRKDSLLIPWVVSFITLAVPFIAKIKYSITHGWTFVLGSYNTSILIVVMVSSPAFLA
jgi:hypothetical protein